WFVGVISQSRAPAVFILGDSLVDSGNNDYLATTARADYRPYGIDFPTRASTGRFSNGLNIADFICESVGAEPVLPYLSPSIGSSSNLVRGANFASAGVGILNDTGVQFVDILRLPVQLRYFAEYQNRVAAIIGRSATNQLIANALVSITLGGNDYVNNYYLVPVSARSIEYPSIVNYTNFIISEYKKILARLYELGARRIMVTAVGPLGCVPSQRALRTVNGSCDPTLQRAAALFNGGLLNIIRQLNSQYGSTVYTFANSFSMNMDVVSNPGAFGFVTSQIACCGQGRFNGIGLCNPTSSVCPNRNIYVFWDNYHPTERANRLIVSRFMNGGESDMYPVNLRTLLELDV
ncbi:hypothetical protein KI387_005754, partial [Taxus chinensis]